ncbi:TetR/AcrR family transcriptional regulator [Corynebacterium atypicum]|uniref:TetR/AcrR family transcriptional regulator n=1 Tax=Corynebacterium atypicum TaxID=191610 RepID=UPI0006908821|nr:TetR family transcriptional regulator [Corynebacterium atypicum]
MSSSLPDTTGAANAHPPGASGTGHQDPQRRERIIDSTLAVIAGEGVRQTSLRKIAHHARVPLGSITYYFAGRDELMAEAFKKFTSLSAAEFAAAFDGVASLSDARSALCKALSSAATTDPQAIALSIEMYALSLRSPRYRAIFQRWLRLCRQAMAQYFDQQTVLIIDALYEGFLIHRFFETDTHDAALVRSAVERLTPPESFIHPHAGGSAGG